MLLKEEFAQTMDWINPAIDAIIMTAKGAISRVLL